MSQPILGLEVSYAQNGAAKHIDERGMRQMQARAYEHRGEQYLLIKSPPASGKSRALMFIALDKLYEQGVKQALIVVPETSIGASFNSTALTQQGFDYDWEVPPQWNLCNAPGADDPKVASGKVKAVEAFLASEDRVLVCTHATFRFAFDALGVAAFDHRLIAIDEFHHVSAHPDNRLGAQFHALIEQGKAHIVAMTGSYFRGDAVAVMNAEDEARFKTVTYTYYEQLNGYEHLKSLRMHYAFYSGQYIDGLMQVLDDRKKTIIHIPNVNSAESYSDKLRQTEEILDALGTWLGRDENTGFQRVKTADGRVLKVADLVDDSPQRAQVMAALKSPQATAERDFVDMIIALGMAKEGFDWIWCEHALTVGYRSSLTEIVQIIGRATRDAPGKHTAQFTNLLREVEASVESVTEAVNDTLKAIAACLLMEQVINPKMEFTPKFVGPKAGFDYGEAGYQLDGHNVGYNPQTGQTHIEIKGIAEPQSDEAKRICAEDLNELLASFIQDKQALERGVFDEEAAPQENTQLRLGRIIASRYPELDAEDAEAVRQHAVAAIALARKSAEHAAKRDEPKANTAFVDGIRQYVLNVTELDVDLIDSVNPFQTAHAILSKAMDEKTLRRLSEVIGAKRAKISIEEARELAQRAVVFKRQHGRLPALTAHDPYEKLLAEGVAVLQREATKA